MRSGWPDRYGDQPLTRRWVIKADFHAMDGEVSNRYPLMECALGNVA